MTALKLVSEYTPSGNQPEAIQQLYEGVNNHEKNQVLLGVTGSGKTFTMAHVIEKFNRPSLILAPNKTLAAQLYGEMKQFFPDNAVEYFVSYYDYYQPEAYVPRTDTYIEKESTINEQIDRMRHAATRALLERRDTVVVASVSCIYGIGAVDTYAEMKLPLEKGQSYDLEGLIQSLVELQYKRNDFDFSRGNFRLRGDSLDIFPAHYEDKTWRFSFFGDDLEGIQEIDPLTGEIINDLDKVTVYPNSHYVTPTRRMQKVVQEIKSDLRVRLDEFHAQDKRLEAQRLEQRISFDLEMLETTKMCAGIENYSRYLTGRAPGEPPPTLFEYLPEDALLFVDESHVTVPQLGGMYKGDRSRKETLSEHGFRLPSCKDNRPLKFEEWDGLRPQTIFVSATPGPWEMNQTGGAFVEQIIRPTGLLDPVCLVRPTTHQVDDLIHECVACQKKNLRVLVTTLTKRMAEALCDYLKEAGLKVSYIHSDVKTLERIEIIQDLRKGVYDVLVGINLLREGLDIPECGLVAILDADKEGFLRSKTSLIQTIGRAARNLEGRAILYADKMTQSIQSALEETQRRREKQQAYNAENGITPSAIVKNLTNILDRVDKDNPADVKKEMSPELRAKKIKQLDKLMKAAASNLEFEEAAKYRDEIQNLEKQQIGI